MKLGIYCRISRAKDGNDLSIADQKQKGIKKAKELGLPYELYIDEGISAASDNIRDRPEFERLLADITRGNLSAVFAYDQSRFERNPEVRWFIKKIFKENNLRYYTELDGEVDLYDPQAEFYGDLMSVINKFQVTLTKIKVKSALKTRVESGKAHAVLPYGYKKDNNGMLVVDDEESEIVKKIYDFSLSGMGTRSIADYLNDHQVPTRYSKTFSGTKNIKNRYTKKITIVNKKDIKWAGNTVRGIIKNTLYKGVRMYSGDSYAVPEIISPSLWQKVQENLENNRNSPGKKVVHKYLLKGLLRCGICGRNMYGRTRVSKHDNHYMCSSKRLKGNQCGNRSINIDKIEAFIWDRFFKGEEFLNRIRKELETDNKELTELNKEIETLQNKIKSLENEKNRAIELVVKGTLSEEDVTSILNKTNIEIKTTKEELRGHMQRLYVVENDTRIIDKYNDEFIHYTKNTTFQQKQRIINNFIENIEVKYDNVVGEYEITISFKVGIPNETYTTYNDFNVVSGNVGFYVPKTLPGNKFKFKSNLVTFPSAIRNQIRLLRISGLPYKVVDNALEVVYNTIVPYGNVEMWNDEELIEFRNQHPELYCQESGVSLKSKNTDLANYERAKLMYHKEVAKKNDITPSLTTPSSEIV
jgi:site-specific DNA recombinase